MTQQKKREEPRRHSRPAHDRCNKDGAEYDTQEEIFQPGESM